MKAELKPSRRLAVFWVRLIWFCGVGLGMAGISAASGGNSPKLRRVAVSATGKYFVLSGSGARFTPWGFNYDRDSSGKLLEDFWEDDWPEVVRSFKEMKSMGANTVRVHLQTTKFMRSALKADPGALAQLARLVKLAEETGLYLDLTGLGCYKKEDVPGWFNALGEPERWDAQARFWEAVAKACAASPAIFCYDLMNEPVVAEDKAGRDWTPNPFGNRYYVQRLTLDFAGRTPEQIARAWVNKMCAAIRRYDSRRLITVGAIPWALTFPGAKPLFYSRQVSQNLDFVSLHLYPQHSQVPQALKALSVYDIGKPIVIEEMFPLNCTMDELAEFIAGSRPMACGWLGFYWGKTIDDYKRERRIQDQTTLQLLEYFVSRRQPSL